MNDIRSHIIFGIDDGSKDEAMSLKMLQKAAASGTTSIFATSHLLQATNHPAWQNFLVGAEKLRALASEIICRWQFIPAVRCLWIGICWTLLLRMAVFV